MRAIVVHEPGGPEVLRYEEVDDPTPGPGQVVVRNHAVGVNFIDIYRRKGAYAADFPTVPGLESAGVVAAVDGGVSGIRVGDRVASASVQGGAYADFSVVDAAQIVRIPDEVSFEVACALLLQGMTAHFLAYDTFPLEVGETALVHAAAGGVGHLLVQLARLRGARVIATVSTDEKERLARELGANEVVRYREVDVADEVRRLTDGRGVDVVYDAVGRDTFDASLRCLRPRGMLVLYGQASGPVDPFDPQILNTLGSLFLTRPKLADYTLDVHELRRRADDIFGAVAAGQLEVRIGRSWPLSEASEAHRHLEGRATTGKVLLLPD